MPIQTLLNAPHACGVVAHLMLIAETAPFMGHVLTPEGLRPSTDIVTAVLDMLQPQDKAAT